MTDPLAAFRNVGGSQNAQAQQSDQYGGITKDQVQNGINYAIQHGGDPKAACIELLKSQGKSIPSNPFALALQLLSGGK